MINATGVRSTNLGRAPLPADAVDAVEAVAGGYSNLEYDAAAGARGSRRARRATGARSRARRPPVAVNNAAAVLLAVGALAAAAR